jgi:hypothetical protein
LKKLIPFFNQINESNFKWIKTLKNYGQQIWRFLLNQYLDIKKLGIKKAIHFFNRSLF